MPREAPVMWTLESAREFITRIRPAVVDAGYDIGLAGSVLYNGKSEKDLDLILYPLSTHCVNLERLRDALNVCGLACDVPRYQVVRRWVKLGSMDTKFVEVWCDAKGRRVDLFFLS